MTLETGDGAPRASGFNWPRALLIASLAINLLFIGGFARAVWHHRFNREHGLMNFARQLPDERRKSFRDEVIEARKKIAPLRTGLRADWLESNKVLTEEPFDKEKFRASLGKVAESEKQLRLQIYDAVTDAAANMSADERRAFQHWREQRHGRRFGHHRHGNKSKDGEDD